MTVERVGLDGWEATSAAPEAVGAATDAAPATGPSPSVIRLLETPDLHEPSASCRYRSWRLAAKWAFDRSLGVAALVLALPVLLVLAVGVLLSSRGPVLFTQTRVGRGGRAFTIYKFRTMRPDAEVYLQANPDLARQHRENDFKLPVDDDTRVTRFGRLLRRTSLDELPQLLNIVKADMSFVGPRPVVPDELDEYGPYRLMYEAAYPGLTGAWQVNGRYSVRYPARAHLDAEYVEDWRFWKDLAIIVRTVPVVLSRMPEASEESPDLAEPLTQST